MRKHLIIFFSFFMGLFPIVAPADCTNEVKRQAKFIWNANIQSDPKFASLRSEYENAALQERDLLNYYKSGGQGYEQAKTKVQTKLDHQKLQQGETLSCTFNGGTYDSSSCKPDDLLKACALGLYDCLLTIYTNEEAENEYTTALTQKLCSPQANAETHENPTDDAQESQLPTVSDATVSSTTGEDTASASSANTSPKVEQDQNAQPNQSTSRITITGTVRDKDDPLPGATIIDSNNPSHGTITDVNGKFTLTDVDSNATIKISYIGYKAQELPATPNMDTITLEDSSETLKAVSFVGCQITAVKHAKEVTYDEALEQCVATACESPYIPGPSGLSCEIDSFAECTKKPNNAAITHYEENKKGELVCIVDLCDYGYKTNENNTDCIDDPIKCECGTKNVDNICIPLTDAEKDCTNPKTGATKATLECNGDKTVCNAKECDEANYTLDTNKQKCIAKGDKCVTDEPAHSKRTHREYDKVTQTDICIVDDCVDGYKPSDDKQSCVSKYSDEDIKELEAKAKAAKDKENSQANRMLGGTSIGAAGIGGMMLGQSLAEQRADAAAEQDMAAYLATFRCEYGNGTTVPAGPTDIDLPGANQLFNLYQEYINLASELQETKQALNIKPGIESETILDKANGNLYENNSKLVRNGTFASVARALSNSDSEDAKKWDEQKSSTQTNLDIGIGAGATGVVGGITGNASINKLNKTSGKTTTKKN